MRICPVNRCICITGHVRSWITDKYVCYSGYKYISIRKNERYSGHGNRMSQPEQWSSKILLFIGFNHVGVNYSDPVSIWIPLPIHHAKQNRLNMLHLVTNGFISLVSRIIKLLLYFSGDLKSRLVWILNVQKEVGLQMVRILNGI